MGADQALAPTSLALAFLACSLLASWYFPNVLRTRVSATVLFGGWQMLEFEGVHVR